MTRTRSRLATAAGILATCALALSPAPSAHGQPTLTGQSTSQLTSQPQAPDHQRAPEAQQAEPREGVTIVGELRTVDSSLSRATNGRVQILRHEGARYVKVHFAQLRLGAGESVTVANAEGTESYTYTSDPTVSGRAGNDDFTTDGKPGFWAMSVQGDTAVVTLKSSLSGPEKVARIDKFWRGLTRAEIKRSNPLESVCSTDARRDVVCYRTSHPTEFARSGAVARMLVNGSGHCTAWRVGNGNTMLTNNHCTASQSELNGQELQFAYQCATCGGNDPAAGTKVSGNTLLKTSGDGGGGLDYTLFSVNNFASISSFGTLYLDPRAPVAGERIYIVGHGDGDPKELSLYNNTQAATDYCTVNQVSDPDDTHNFNYMCDTSGGSSGSPVFSSGHKVIGLHHLGGCPNEAAKISLIEPEIRSLIDNTPPSGNDFSIAASPSSATVAAGASTTTTVSTTTTNGTAQSVALSASGLPTGATASFSPATVTSGGSSTLTLTTTASTPAGSYPLTVTGTGSGATRTTTFTLTVTAPPTPGCSGSNGTDVAIADNATATSTIGIGGCTGTASSTAKVGVNIQHTYIGDLVVALVAPDGSSYTLHNRTGSGTDNIVQTYTVNLSAETANGTWTLRVQDAAGGDVGKIDSWSLDLGGTPPPPGCAGTNGADVAIADNATVSSTIAISGCTGTASSTSKVEVHIQHTYIGDLVVSLVAPDGTSYTLHDRAGAGTDNIDQTYTVNLSAETRNGTWTLRVQDAASQDTGKIDGWTLTL